MCFRRARSAETPWPRQAGIATLKTLRDESPYARLEQLGEKLAAGLDEAASAARIEHTVARVGSMLTLFFNPEPVTNWDVAARSNTEQFGRYFWGLIRRGVYMPCSQYEAPVHLRSAYRRRHRRHDLRRPRRLGRSRLMNLADRVTRDRRQGPC